MLLHSAILLLAEFFRNHPKTLKDRSSILHLDEGILLQIFDYLNIFDLLQAGQVCKTWYRIARDCTLWKSLDLKPLKKPFSSGNELEYFFLHHPVTRLINLDLSGLQLTGRVFTALTTNCPRLKKLVLNAANFVTEENWKRWRKFSISRKVRIRRPSLS